MTADACNILLVDDEEVLVWSLANRLARARPSWRVRTAHTGEDALELVRAEPVDLLVADVRMPKMSGIDLVLAARADYPKLPVIVMTAYPTPEMQRILGAPYTGFLEKPFEFERLLELIEEARNYRTRGFSGPITVQTLPDVVQLYVLSSATGLMTVKHRDDEGRMWFERGAILHAETRAARGDEAFYEIMMWTGGEFRMRVGARSAERSVKTDWQGLLMESCRRIDEAERDSAPEDDGPRGWMRSVAPPSIDEFDNLFDDLPKGNNAPTDLHAFVTHEAPEDSPKVEAIMNVKDSLTKLNQIDGFIGAALVDSESGMLLGAEGGGSVNLEVAAAGNTEVVRAKRKTMSNLNLKDGIEDILITLGRQYHIIRPLRSRSTLFFYVAVDRSRANLAMARIALADVEKDLVV